MKGYGTHCSSSLTTWYLSHSKFQPQSNTLAQNASATMVGCNVSGSSPLRRPQHGSKKWTMENVWMFSILQIMAAKIECAFIWSQTRGTLPNSRQAADVQLFNLQGKYLCHIYIVSMGTLPYHQQKWNSIRQYWVSHWQYTPEQFHSITKFEITIAFNMRSFPFPQPLPPTHLEVMCHVINSWMQEVKGMNNQQIALVLVFLDDDYLRSIPLHDGAFFVASPIGCRHWFKVFTASILGWKHLTEVANVHCAHTPVVNTPCSQSRLVSSELTPSCELYTYTTCVQAPSMNVPQLTLLPQCECASEYNKRTFLSLNAEVTSAVGTFYLSPLQIHRVGSRRWVDGLRVGKPPRQFDGTTHSSRDPCGQRHQSRHNHAHLGNRTGDEEGNLDDTACSGDALPSWGGPPILGGDARECPK